MGSAELPDGIVYIGNSAFLSCSSLAGINIPNGVTTIGDSAFAGCAALEELTLPETVKTIGSSAFSHCESLKTMVIPDGVTAIERDTFYVCYSLERVIIPDSVVKIGRWAFGSCTSLRSIEIPDSVTTFDTMVFRDCTSLTEIKLPSGITEFPERFFDNCASLTVNVPESVKTIGRRALYNVGSVFFTGDAPRFDIEAFGDSPNRVNDKLVLAVYPAGNSTWTETLEQEFYGKIKWVPDDYGNVEDYARDPSEPLDGAESSNMYDHNYISNYRWADNVNSYLIKNEDGSFTRVEHIGDKVVVEEYDRDFKLTWKKTLDMEMTLWGGFYSGTEYNFLVFGEKNTNYYTVNEDGTVTLNDNPVIRIVRYTKNWHRMDHDELCGANTFDPFRAGSLSMVEYNDRLYINTCHQMLNGHQANMSIILSIPYMTMVNSYFNVGSSGGYGYVSHSFNQLMADDWDYIVSLDHGDSYTRGLVINKSYKGNGKPEEKVIYPICGNTGANDTGVSVGGFEVSDSAYLTAGNSVKQDPDNFNFLATRNIFVLATDKDSLETTTNWLTHYEKDDPVTVLNPHLVKVSDREFVLLWSEIRDEVSKTYYVRLDGRGNAVSEVYSTDYQLSDCKPVVRGNELIWYTTGDKYYSLYYVLVRSTTEPVFCVLDYTKQAESVLKGDVNLSGKVENTDLILVARYIVKIYTAETKQNVEKYGDMNGDGVVTNTDLITIARIIVGLE